MFVGYARVSTVGQTLEPQIDELKAAGCTTIFFDTVSGTKAAQTGLEKALNSVGSDDTLVVCQLDRLGRSLKQIVEMVATLRRRGIGFKSLHENIDTTAPEGPLIFRVFGALAESEQALVKERAQGRKMASRTRARGKKGGRPSKLTPQQIALMQKMHDDQRIAIEQILETFKVSKATLYRYIRADSQER